jgi:hypothetical protein
MRLILHKMLRPEKPGDPFVHLAYTGEMDNVPLVGGMITTGALKTQIGGVTFDHVTGWFATEWDDPNLASAIKDVEDGKSNKQVLKEHLAEGWKIVDPPIALFRV